MEKGATGGRSASGTRLAGGPFSAQVGSPAANRLVNAPAKLVVKAKHEELK
jgi:hypothetical protein